MFDIFPDQPSYEYPPLINVLYALIWAFILSSIVAITHKLTFKGGLYPKNFFQSMVLGGIITAMVMLAIGDSLARGLGVFGAMAIIRFRTRIDDPRNVLFLFAALSTGIAIGVYGYTISFAGTIVFCFVAALLHFTRFKSTSQTILLEFSLTDIEKLPGIHQIMEQYCEETELLKVSVNRKSEIRYEYELAMHDETEKDKLIFNLSKIEGVTQLTISKQEGTN